ncbi:hypothetical protein C5167_049225 [Papaver somniferum]|uniref:Peptidyl-prolyl cis-trans isomerase n=1 Tax=Papaver somniferum TaxID=3469 RepID=A0A4Y7KLL0_PAPSO|nr:hypothetical protein C5167_049225 [Papaver somniferum]
MVGSLFRVGNSRMNSTKDTNAAQFFVTIVATPWLDNKHAIFDKVMKEMGVVQVCNITSETTTKKPAIVVSTLAFVKELRTPFEDVVEKLRSSNELIQKLVAAACSSLHTFFFIILKVTI